MEEFSGETLLSSRAAQDECLEQSYIKNLWKRLMHGTMNWPTPLCGLMMSESWCHKLLK